jgi:hypothetical protein
MTHEKWDFVIWTKWIWIFPSICSNGFEAFKVEMLWVRCKWSFHDATFNIGGQMKSLYIIYIYIYIFIYLFPLQTWELVRQFSISDVIPLHIHCGKFSYYRVLVCQTQILHLVWKLVYQLTWEVYLKTISQIVVQTFGKVQGSTHEFHLFLLHYKETYECHDLQGGWIVMLLV